MTTPYLPFVDWLKAVGLLLIVYGHVAAATTVSWTPPVYPKQVGVAFFVFVTGFTLAREQRGARRVVFNRYFEVFFFGACFALLMSGVGLVLWSDPNESNYLPLFFGANVLMNDFPANPTTWYIGTYLHLLLLWAILLRPLRIGLRVLIAALIIEVIARTILIDMAGRFVAYMLFTNWLGVLVIGLWYGRSHPGLFDQRRRSILLWVAVMIAWSLVMMRVPWVLTFPLMSLSTPGLTGTLVEGILPSLVYLGFTCGACVTALHLPAFRPVRFIARNSVFVFIAHMPVYYLLEYVLTPILPDYAPRVAVEMLVCLPGLALVSEGVCSLLRIRALRDRLAAFVERRVGTSSLLTSRA
jgi:hypothetical protein